MTEDLQTRETICGAEMPDRIYLVDMGSGDIEWSALSEPDGDAPLERVAYVREAALTAERDAALARVEAMREALVSIRETAETREYSGRVGGASLWREGLVSIFAKARAALAAPSGAMDREEASK